MRTVVQTVGQTDVIKVCEGEYFHWDLDNIIEKIIKISHSTLYPMDVQRMSYHNNHKIS